MQFNMCDINHSHGLFIDHKANIGSDKNSVSSITMNLVLDFRVTMSYKQMGVKALLYEANKCFF